MSSRRLGAVLAVAVALGLIGRAGAQDEAGQEAAAICKNPQCPGIVSAWQQDIKACGERRQRVADLQGKLDTCLPGRADAEKRAQEAESRVAELKKEIDRLHKEGKGSPDAELAKAVETASALKNEADRLRAEVERLTTENGKLRQLVPEGKKLSAPTPEGKKATTGEGKKKQAAPRDKTKPAVTEDKKQPEVASRATGEGSGCVALTVAVKGVCFVKTSVPGWLMARSGDRADDGATLFLRPFIDPGLIPRLPQAGASGACGPLREALKALQPLDPRPSVDAVFVRSGEAVAQCYDSGEGGWKLRPVSKSDRKHQAWILIPETPGEGGGVRP
jgi:hypothetical protein